MTTRPLLSTGVAAVRRTLSAEEIYSTFRAQAPDVAHRVVFFTGGPAPQHGIDRPVVNKMLAWEEFVLSILRAVQL
ncbi:MAG: hypothetical protein EXR92_02310 [Gemmatimonadetes bacterium]|nr:hypothetical protein [Gemmatimonadota bacterium]